MTDETAFFRFGTNAELVANDIVQAMDRINQSLGRNVGSSQTFADAQGFAQGFDRLKRDLQSGVAEVEDLMRRLGTGDISRAEFDRDIRQTIQGRIGAIPDIAAEQLGLMKNRTVAGRLPLSAISQQAAQEFADTMVETARRGRALAEGKLKGVPLTFDSLVGEAVANVDANPVNFGKEQERVARLRNQVLAESLVARDPLGYSPESAQLEQLLGMERVAQRIRDTQVVLNDEGEGKLIPSTAAAELKELEAEQREAATTANRLEREREQAAAATEKLARAERDLANATRVNKSTFIGDEGVSRKTAAGNVPVENSVDVEDAVQAAKRLEEEQANMRRLLDAQRAGQQIDRVGSYDVLGQGPRDTREVYKVNPDGTLAQRIRSEYTVKKILDQQDDAIARQMLRLQGVNELENRRARDAARGQSGLLGGFLNRFNRGEDSVLTGLGGQVASAAAFTLAYGSIFALQAAIRDTVAEFIDYQDSVTDLQVATGSADAVTESWIRNLTQLSRVAGSNVGVSLDAAARGVRAFGEGPDGDQAANELVGTQTARAATDLSRITGKAVPDTTGDVVAIGTAYELAGDQLDNITEAVANAKRTIGGDAAQISQGLSYIAISAREAGFDLSEAAAAIALVQSRTDQSGQAIATRLTRVFQIVQGSTGKSLAFEFKKQLNKLGVSGDDPVSDQLAAYSKIFVDAEGKFGTTEGDRDRLVSGLGGTANSRELLPLLKEGDRLAQAYADSFDNAGAATQELNRKTEAFFGTLKQLSADIKAIQIGLSKSGLFDFVGIAAKGLEPVLNGFGNLLSVINEITDKQPALRTAVGLAVNAAVLAKGIGVVQAKQGLLGFGGSAAGAAGDTAEAVASRASVVARERETAQIYGAAAARAAAEGRMNEVITYTTAQRAALGRAEAAGTVAGAGAAGTGRFAQTRSGFSALGAFVGSTGFIATAGVASLLYAYGKQVEAEGKLELAQETFDGNRAALQRTRQAGYTSESLQQAAQDTVANAGTLTSMNKPDQYEAEIDALARVSKERADGLKKLADQVEIEQRRAAATDRYNVFGSDAISTTNQLADGLQAIADSGGTALTQIRELRKALATEPGEVGTINGGPRAAQAQLTTIALANLDEVKLPTGTKAYPNGVPEPIDMTEPIEVPNSINPYTGQPNRIMPGTEQYALARGRQLLEQESTNPAFTDPDAIKATIDFDPAKAFRQAMKDLGIDPKEGISPAQQKELLQAMIDSANFDGVVGDVDAIKKEWYEQSMKALRRDQRSRNTNGVPNDLLNGKELTRSQIVDLLKGREGEEGEPGYIGLEAAFQAGYADIPKSDDGTVLQAEMKANLRTLKRDLKSKFQGDNAIPELELAIDNLQHDIAAYAVQKLDDARAVAEAGAKSTAQLQRIRLRYAKLQFDEAGGNRAIIESLMTSMDRKTIKAVIDYVNTARDIARRAYEHARAIVSQAASILKGANPLEGLQMFGDEYADMKAKQKEFRDRSRQLEALEGVFEFSPVTEPAAVYTPPADSGGGSGGSGSGSDPAAEAEEAKRTAQERAQDRADKIAAMAEARAARLGGNIASARAALVGARAQLGVAKKGTTEWYQALAGLYQAQWQMTEAIQDYRSTIYQLQGDFTDPVEQARDALRAARDRFRSARAKDEKASARLEVEQSEVALQQAKWDQKLSDMQIAEQLGQISYATYIRYLERESNRMSKIRNKSRAQIDHMNQIDLELKAAMEAASGQFNLGDIGTRGFIYQTRRFAQEARRQQLEASGNPGIAAGGQHINTNNNITINGTDVQMVRKVLREMLGDTTIRRSTNAARRR